MRKRDIWILSRYGVSGRHVDQPILITIDGNRFASIKYISSKHYSSVDLGQDCSNVGETVCEILFKKQASGKTKEFLDLVSNNEVVRLNTVGEIKYGFGGNGQTTSEPEETQLPEYYSSFYKDVAKESYDEALRIIGLYQWTHGEAGWVNSLRGLDEVWSFDKRSWYPLPSEFTIELSSPVKNVPSSVPSLISKLYLAEERLPVYREMLGEVDEKKMSRSSFVTLIGALELAVKVYMSKQIPEAQWLAMEAPTPPVVRMLEEFVPKVPCTLALPNKHDLRFSKRIIETVRKGVVIRNNIAHKGGVLPSENTIHKLHEAVSDVISTLEYSSGFEWASGYISNNTRKELGFAEVVRDDSFDQVKEAVFCTVTGHVRRQIVSDLLGK